MRVGFGGQSFDLLPGETVLAGLERQGAAFGESEELLGKPLRRGAGLVGVIQRRVVAIVPRERNGAKNRREQIVEIVRDPAGEKSQ